jgi:hypothetical protein
METSDDNPPKAYTGMIIGYTCLITALGQTLDKHEVTPEAYLVAAVWPRKADTVGGIDQPMHASPKWASGRRPCAKGRSEALLQVSLFSPSFALHLLHGNINITFVLLYQ